MSGTTKNRGFLAGMVLLAFGLRPSMSGAEPVRILPLGDSITHGFYSGVIIYNSYRKELKNMLDAGGYNTDFVGSLINGDFADNQHEGHDGWYADDATSPDTLLSHMADWMLTYDPNIVLLHIGTNDIIHDDADASEVSDILDAIFTANSNATVVLSLVISVSNNYNNLGPAISTYNSNLNAMAQARIAGGDDILVVDMENGAGLDYNSTDMSDPYHPSPDGYDKMATNWFPSVTTAITRQLARRAPRILSVAIESDSLTLQIGNLPTGTTVDVERTTSLSSPDWTHLVSAQATNTSIVLTGLDDPTNSHSFYRAAIP